MLTEAINVLDRPSLHARERVQEAQGYLDRFKVENAGKLHMFFLTYFEFTDGQHQHKFWTLGAINDVLTAAVQCRLLDSPHPVDLDQCKEVYLDLMRSRGPQILN